jgi:hypothetical protein
MYQLGEVWRMISLTALYLAIFGNFLNEVTVSAHEFRWILYAQVLGRSFALF